MPARPATLGPTRPLPPISGVGALSPISAPMRTPRAATTFATWQCRPSATRNIMGPRYIALGAERYESCPMVPNRSVWFRLVPFRSVWCRLVPNRSQRFQVVPSGSAWCRPDVVASLRCANHGTGCMSMKKAGGSLTRRPFISPYYPLNPLHHCSVVRPRPQNLRNSAKNLRTLPSAAKNLGTLPSACRSHFPYALRPTPYALCPTPYALPLRTAAGIARRFRTAGGYPECRTYA